MNAPNLAIGDVPAEGDRLKLARDGAENAQRALAHRLTSRCPVIAPICGTCGREIDKNDLGWFHVEAGRYSPTDETAAWVKRWPTTAKVHTLKTVQPFFASVRLGIKPFEVRRNDRDFKAGDLLVLAEWDGEYFTGQDCAREVTYVLRDAVEFGVHPGFVVLGLRALGSIR